MVDFIDVSDVTPRIAYTATAAQTVFVVPFVFFSESDLVVTVNDVLKVLSTDYVTSGAEDPVGGTITFNAGLLLNDVVVITRTLEYELTTHIPASGPLDIPSVNLQFSKFVAMLQQIDADRVRSIKQPSSDVTDLIALPVAASRANMYLFFDANGAISLVGAVSTSVPASAFILTLMPAADAATARTTLGITDTSAAVAFLNWQNFR